jgi:hypothetical protein
VAAVAEVELKAPALQSQMCAADYVAAVRTSELVESMQGRVEALLATPTLPRRRQHKGQWQAYDLRPLVHRITVAPGGEGEQVLTMRLQASPERAGRPDEVLDALGLSLLPHTVERITLLFQFDN